MWTELFNRIEIPRLEFFFVLSNLQSGQDTVKLQELKYVLLMPSPILNRPIFQLHNNICEQDIGLFKLR